MVVTYCTGNLEKHGEKVHEFMLEHFRVTEPICVSLDPTKEELFDFFVDLRKAGLSDNFSTLAFDDDELIGISLNTVKDLKNDSLDSILNYGEDDYCKAISEGPYKSRNTNRILTFIETLENGMDRLLEEPGRILKIDVLCVRSDYQRQGIAQSLVSKAIETARQDGCKWVGASATAVASQSLFEKMDFRIVRELSFDCFKEDGIPVFRDVPDGGNCGKFMICNIDKQ